MIYIYILYICIYVYILGLFQVYVICGGQECCGVVQQHNHMDNQVSILLPALGQHILRKVEDVWTTPSTPPPPPTTPSTVSSPLTVSSCIDVPRR